MTKHVEEREYNPSERRKHERVHVTYHAQVLVLDSRGKKLGVLRQLGRGGFLMEPEKSFTKDGKVHKLTLHEPHEEIHAQVSARVLYADARAVGFEFVDLDPDAAVEVGIIIGKYYEGSHG